MEQKRAVKPQNWFRVRILIKLVLLVGISLSFGWFVVPNSIRLLIANKIAISPENSEFYSIWLNPPVPVYFSVTMFNVLNPDEIEKGMSPRFTERGPYVFQEIRTKINITLDDDNDTATYMQHIRYEFISELSGNRSLNDVITMINVPFVTAADRVEKSVHWPLNHIAHMILLNYKEPLFIKKTVEEALFKGWKVPMLEKIEEDIGLSFLENNTFSFFMGMNDTNQGPYTIMRGIQGDKQLLGKIVKYRDEPVLSFWGERNSSCNKLRGTDAFIFPPFNVRGSTIQAFNADLCGSLNLEYNTDIEIEGVHGLKFTIPSSQLASARENVDNRCYCRTIDTAPEKCLASGAVDLGPCRDDAPIALSQPHFLGANPVYLQNIAEGVKPDREKHEMFIALEPLTGIVLEANKRFQLSVILKRISSIPSLSKVKEVFFPCLWANEGARVDEPTGKRLSLILLLINLMEYGIKFVTTFVAVVAVVVFGRKLRLNVVLAVENNTFINRTDNAANVAGKFEGDHILSSNDDDDEDQ